METKTCANCTTQFPITPDDLAFYKQIDVPAPTLCPQCRYQRRIANRNEWIFYTRNCGLCKKPTVTIYNEDYPGPVYCQPCWWGDGWDTLEYERDFDFSKTFFEQFAEHRFNVPRIALANTKSVNSEYTNQSNDNKNCFMCVATCLSEDCLYGQWNQGSKECVDCYSTEKCELLYESISCVKCSTSAYLENCRDCSHSIFLYDCRGCTNCVGCVGLRNKSHYWFNETLSKEEYEKRYKALMFTHNELQKMKEKFEALTRTLPRKYYEGRNNVNTTGNYIEHNKNVTNTFYAHRTEDTSNSQDAWEARNCMDLTETLDNELDYELEGVGWASNNIIFSKGWYGSHNLYTELSFHAHNTFGCVGIVKKNYCIFNKQYGKEEYETFKEKIIAHMKETKEWGEFFPIEISPFAYNETVAQEYFPLTKDEVIKKGYKWYDRPERNYNITITADKIPTSIKETPDSIVEEVIECSSRKSKILNHTSEISQCTTAFKITPAELTFYKKMNLPLPHLCGPCRRHARLEKRNPRKLWHRTCMKEGCSNEFETSYTPERPEIVYCETCYTNEVV